MKDYVVRGKVKQYTEQYHHYSIGKKTLDDIFEEHIDDVIEVTITVREEGDDCQLRKTCTLIGLGSCDGKYDKYCDELDNWEGVDEL